MKRINYILELLYKNSAGWLSGEDISRDLGISRSAVWKYIKLLRESGYNIESSSRHGHRLISRSNTLNEFEIRRNIKTEIFGRKDIHVFNETDSTNIQAFKLAAAGADEGSIVLAESQTLGKGRLGRKWISPAGMNIYLSVIIRPKIPTLTAPRLTLVTAVALSETLDLFGAAGHRIKWPNDMLFNGKKLSGILTEMKGDCDTIDFIIIGLGINLNSSSENFTDEFKNTVVSLKDIIGEETDRIDFLNCFLLKFEKNYFEFLHDGFPEILQRWILKSKILNQKIEVTNYNEVFTGIVTDVSPDGNLLVKTDNGLLQVNSGDINYLQDDNK